MSTDLATEQHALARARLTESVLYLPPDVEPGLTAAADVQTGAMIAFVPAAEQVHQLALDDPTAEPAAQLHVTSVYLGDAVDWSPDMRSTLIEGVRALVADWVPIAARSFGVAILNPTGDTPCLVLIIGGDDLAAAQEQLEELGYASDEQHAPWLAHLTLGYAPDPRVWLTDTTLARAGMDLELDRIRVAFAGETTDILLTGGGLTADAFRAYTRDSHGQFATTGGSGVRGSLAEAGTSEEVAGALHDELHRITGRDVPVSFRGMDPQLAREHSEGILRVAERHPEAKIGGVATYDLHHPPPTDRRAMAGMVHAYTDEHTRVIHFNVGGGESGPGRESRYKVTLEREQSTGWIRNGTPMGVGAHEMSHVVVEGNQPALMSGYLGMLGRNTRRTESPTDFTKRSLSKYAATSEHELAAEALADVVLNGGHASPTSIAVTEGIESHLPAAS
jgi:2'-5' RNA ligase superfamily